MKNEDLWPAILGQLQLQMTRATFDTWLKDTHLVALDHQTLTIGCKNGFAQDWLENRLFNTIKTVVEAHLGREIDLRFVVASEVPQNGHQMSFEEVYDEDYTRIVKPNRVFVGTQYFRQVWGPILGPTLTLLILELRQRCYWNQENNEKRDKCRATHEDLGRAIGVSEVTVRRALKSPLASCFILKKKTERRYSRKQGREVNETTEWKLKMDEPILTDDLLERLLGSSNGQNDH